MLPLSPERLFSLFNSVPLGFVLYDKNGKVFFVNDFLLKMTSYGFADLMDDGFYSHLFKSKESNDRIRERAKSVFAAVFNDLELTLATRTDETLFVHISGSSVLTDEDLFGALVVQDRTNSKGVEKVFESSFDNFIQVTNALDAAMKQINIQNAVLEKYKKNVIRELNIAKSVQKAIIPTVFPKLPDFDMYGIAVPSDELGGDYFDYFTLDDNRIGILIADVSGHGVPSALITTMVKAYFEYFTKRYTEPHEVLQQVNKGIASIIQETGFYLTAFYCVLNLPALELTVSTAGHDCALCVTKGDQKVRHLGEGAEGTILGIFPDAEYKSVTYQLVKNSKVIIFTDGITEARSSTGEFYGTDRLEKFMLSQLGKPSRETVTTLLADVDAFYGTNHPNDDRTFVVFDLL